MKHSDFTYGEINLNVDKLKVATQLNKFIQHTQISIQGLYYSPLCMPAIIVIKGFFASVTALYTSVRS